MSFPLKLLASLLAALASTSACGNRLEPASGVAGAALAGDAFDSKGDGASSETLGVPGCSCGDGACNLGCGESLATCPSDCHACGDKICSPGEGPSVCPIDCCGGCGDGLCRGYTCGENPYTCAQDCGTACGNKVCDKGENPQSCAEDCQWQACGNKVCEPDDGGPKGCTVDCGTACGNCVCEKGESWQDCPMDCGFCGDGVCSGCAQLGELAGGCPVDCASPLPLGTGAVTAAAAKIDFLWVIDHSASMAKHQQELAKVFAGFVDALQTQGDVDAQMAVVTVQQIANVGEGSPGGLHVGKVGAFAHTPALHLPPNAIEHFSAPCMAGPSTAQGSQECKDGFDFTFTAGESYTAPATSLCAPLDGNGLAFGDGMVHFANPFKDTATTNEWRCKSPLQLSQVTNLNGSINSYCWRHCKNKAECEVMTGDPTAICFTPGGGPANAQSGCLVPPSTQDCPLPEMLPPVLKNDQLGLFHCNATVGAEMNFESKFEGGLRSAWEALNPAGANCPHDAQGQPTAACQNKQLLRPDAWLVLVFVSDDDDCSVDLQVSLGNNTAEEKAALKALLPAEDQNYCQRFGDAVGGNPWLNEVNCRYMKSKQPDPSKYLCASDCKPDDGACLAAAAPNIQANLAIDKRFAPVATFAKLFRSLKADPDKVIIAAVTGDSPSTNPAQREIDRVQYLFALRKNQAGAQAPMICQGKRGSSGFGSRYMQLAESLGKNGVVTNICAEATLVPQVQQLAAGIVQRVKAGATGSGRGK